MRKVFAIILVLGLILITTGATFSVGSRGEEVKKLQQTLKDSGYDVGNVDGIYGQKTKEAVEKYQKDNGLKVDGIAGAETLSKLGISANVTNSDTDIYLTSLFCYAIIEKL